MWRGDWASYVGAGGSVERVLREWVECELGDPEEHQGPVERREGWQQGLVEEWLQGRWILVVAVGSDQESGWRSAPAYVTGTNAPYTNDEIAISAEVASADDDDERLREVCVEAIGSLSSGRTVGCAAPGGGLAWQHITCADHRTRPPMHPEALQLAAVTEMDEVTRKTLHALFPEPLQAVDGVIEPVVELIEFVRSLESTSNAIYSAVLQDAPKLRLHLDVATFSQSVEWFVQRDGERGSTEAREVAISVPDWERARSLSGLSSAQKRWASWAIQLVPRI